MRLPSLHVLTALQIAITLFAFATFGLWPPLSGRFLLVPVGGSDRNALALAAWAGGAALLDRGPLPGSLVVVGDRAALARHSGWRTFLILAAPAAGCGGRGERVSAL